MDYASCCVLSYNRPGLLRDTLDTLVAHAQAPFELIVHDDGSEATPEMEGVLADANLLLGATVIRNAPGHNQGQGTALNRMFHMASGDPVIKIDHDLLFNPGWLRTANEILDQNMREQNEPILGLLGLLHYHHAPVASADTIVSEYAGWSQHTHILGSAFAMRREAWVDLGEFEEHSTAFAEDADMQARVTKSGIWVCGLPTSDLCTNVGMGYGPSTVNVAPGHVAEIHDTPYLKGVTT